MDSLSDILSRKDFDEPPEIERVKDFVRRFYDSEVSVSISRNNLLIVADSASLASALRINLPKLEAAASSDKKIIIRIG